jgi:hypothetical protein
MPVGRIPQSYIQKCKVGLHALQAVFIFVAGCLTISVMTKGDIGGATRYYFAMVSTEYQSLSVWKRADGCGLQIVQDIRLTRFRSASLVYRPLSTL